jgi:predicted RecB family nuclease
MKRDFLTATDFYQFLQCPHWPYYERFATPEERALKRPVTSAETRRFENGVAHEHDVINRLFVGQVIREVAADEDLESAFQKTLKLMEEGVPLIYQGTLVDGDWAGRPDLLERHEGESRFGNWFYVPVDVKSSHALEKYHKLQLTFYATLLERVQKRFPAEPAIINRDGERIPFLAGEFVSEFECFVLELERIRAGEKPDPVLRKSCFDTGTWGVLCERFAKETNDIALLFNVDVGKLKSLRSLGIRTVDDAAEMDPEKLDGQAKGLRQHGLEVMKRQAQSLRTQEVIIREPFQIPNTPLEIHFDIESDPPNDRDYLYGFLIRSEGVDSYRAFVAKNLEDEEKMWKSFLEWLETLPADYVVYHFAPYELTRLGILEKRYGGSTWLDLFRSHMVDLKELVTHSVTFPLYFYGLKYIAKFLGFSWRGDVTSGGQSIDVFESYLETRNEALLDSLLMYNEDDVRATAFLKDWLEQYAKNIVSFGAPYPWKKKPTA